MKRFTALCSLLFAGVVACSATHRPGPNAAGGKTVAQSPSKQTIAEGELDPDSDNGEWGILGDPDYSRVVQKVVGMVNSTVSFTEHPKVVNGCSDLLVAVFGDRGRHARCAVGMGSLPFNIPIEIDMIVEIE